MVKPFHPANRGTRYGMRNVNPAETGTRKELENEKNWERRTILVDWAMPGYADPLCVVFFWLVLTARNHWKDVTSKRSDCSACFQILCIRDSRHQQNTWKIWPILADSWLTNSNWFLSSFARHGCSLLQLPVDDYFRRQASFTQYIC